MSWTKRWRKRLRALLHREAVERELEEELAFHLEMATKKNLDSGLSAAEARRRAVLEFGGVERFKEEVRDARSLAWITGMSLDLKLGSRLLVKYPGLTVIGSLAITFAIWVGVGAFEFLSQVAFPTLPFEDGDRVVAIRTWDAASARARPSGLHDFAAWREGLRSVDDVGAYRTLERNLITGDGRGEPTELAEISASAFQVTRTRPLLGRTLTAGDEAEDASSVIVLGYDVWRRRFGGSPDVVGRVVRLGREQATVVGVMPEGFGFPVAHQVWMPLRANPLAHPRGSEPRVEVFGRLAPGSSLQEAQAELTAVGLRTAAEFPGTHEHLSPRVMPYARSILNLRPWMSLGILSMNGFLILLLVLVCGNVALLMFARAASREAEIVVRNALGASRTRIVAQMFAEALVLAALAGAAGLALAGYGLRWGMRIVESELLEGPLPFWFHGSLSPASVGYAIGLTLLAAGIAGVVPALKMTGQGLESRLRQGSAGGGGPRFGGLWTAVIVTQVAMTVLFPIITVEVHGELRQLRNREAGFAPEEYLSARLEMDPQQAAIPSADTTRTALLARVRATRAQLEERLIGEAAVTDVTFASNVPGRYHQWNQIELDGGAVVPRDTVRGHRVSRAMIAPDYFGVMRTSVLSGREFHSGDVASGARVAIVNQRFVEDVLGGRNAVGRRVRYIADEDSREPRGPQEGPWYEIVGVAPDLGMTSGYGEAGIYHPLFPDSTASAYLVAHLRGEPESFVPRLQQLAAAVDPTLRLHDILPLDEIDATELEFYDFWFRLTGLLTLVTLVLSWAGIYAVTAFTVSRRTREIGVRVALGADPRRVAVAIFRRPLAQVSMGVGLGAAAFVALVAVLSDPGLGPTARDYAGLVGYSLVMLGVCLLACIVPTRRALRVDPMEALRAE